MDLTNHKRKLSVVTVVCTEAGTPYPLIYTVRMRKAMTHRAVREAVCRERRKDTGESLRTIKRSLEIHFAFAGDLPVELDWRT